jgi:hypothetical protein
MVTKFKDGVQDKYPVWENVLLVEAESFDGALEKAEIRGREDEGDSGGTYLWESRPATLVFAGVRKVIECKNANHPPGDGTEITYSEMEVENEDALTKLVNGEPVIIKYEE